MAVPTSPNYESVASLWTPVSGTVYRQDYGCALVFLSLSVTINPTALAGSTVIAEVSDDGTTWTTYATVGTPAGLTLASAQQQIILSVPTNWAFRFRATNATLGAMFMLRQGV